MRRNVAIDNNVVNDYRCGTFRTWLVRRVPGDTTTVISERPFSKLPKLVFAATGWRSCRFVTSLATSG